MTRKWNTSKSLSISSTTVWQSKIPVTSLLHILVERQVNWFGYCPTAPPFAFLRNKCSTEKKNCTLKIHKHDLGVSGSLATMLQSKKTYPSLVWKPVNNPIRRRTDETKSASGEMVALRRYSSLESALPKESMALSITQVFWSHRNLLWSTTLPAHTVASVSSQLAVAAHRLFPIFRISFTFFVLQMTQAALGECMWQERHLWEHTHCVVLKWLAKWKMCCLIYTLLHLKAFAESTICAFVMENLPNSVCGRRSRQYEMLFVDMHFLPCEEVNFPATWYFVGTYNYLLGPHNW